MNAAQCLKENGAFVYITCSVFSAENEEIVDFIQTNTSLVLEEQHYLRGYDQRADTLFVAIFKQANSVE